MRSPLVKSVSVMVASALLFAGVRLAIAVEPTAKDKPGIGDGKDTAVKPVPEKKKDKPKEPKTLEELTKVDVETPDEKVDRRMRSPAEELAALTIQDGYRLELVASDPEVISPVCMVWDGNGRMYIAEMRSYMKDIDATKEKEPVSRVSRWESTNWDGKYDKHTVFADNLLLPRQVLALDDRIIIRETDTKDMFTYRDTKGTGTADEKVKIFEGGPQNGNLEHQPSGLTWNLDNWMYITHDTTRFRFANGKIETDKMAHSAGQWGMAMDDTGRMIFSTAGGEKPAHDFQAPLIYGKVQFKEELSADYQDIFPVIRLTDVQGGPKRLKPTGGVNHFTGCAGPSVFRGDGLPADFYGDYIVPEPVGRFVRRSKLKMENGKMVISNAYKGKEFIASIDPNFRPVWSATGPDGCLYFCDMYRGIIQEGNWTKEGSYLRNHIQKYGLEKNINGGRIWRLVHDSVKPRSTRPNMLNEKPVELMAHLADANGWWRDTAQKLIVIKQDKSIVPALMDMTLKHNNPIARLHALWTLEGLGSINLDLIRQKLTDSDARVRAAAIRMAEPMWNPTPEVPAVTPVATPSATTNDKTSAAANPATPAPKAQPKTQPKVKPVENVAVTALLKEVAIKDADAIVANQFVLSSNYVKLPQANQLINEVIAARTTAKLSVATQQAILKAWQDNIADAKANAFKQKQLAIKDPELAKAWGKGRENFLQTCVACHGEDGKGALVPENGVVPGATGGPIVVTPGMTLAPPLVGSKKIQGDKELVCRIMLHGLVGPNDGGKTYPGEMAGFKFLDDQFLANIATYVRNDFGNKGTMIKPADFAKVRKETEKRDKPFTLAELIDAKLYDPNAKLPSVEGLAKPVNRGEKVKSN